MSQHTVTIYYLEMTDPTQIRPAVIRVPALHLQRIGIVVPEFHRFLYTAAGGAWSWIDRLPWTYEQWRTYLDRPEVETWVAHLTGTPAGYVELERQPGGNVEIVYFGLVPAFLGQGLGGQLLTQALTHAWQPGTSRVWLHTCSLDGPAALPNYQARGFHLYHHETTVVELPDTAPEPWPNVYGSRT